MCTTTSCSQNQTIYFEYQRCIVAVYICSVVFSFLGSYHFCGRNVKSCLQNNLCIIQILGSYLFCGARMLKGVCKITFPIFSFLVPTFFWQKCRKLSAKNISVVFSFKVHTFSVAKKLKAVCKITIVMFRF